MGAEPSWGLEAGEGAGPAEPGRPCRPGGERLCVPPSGRRPFRTVPGRDEKGADQGCTPGGRPGKTCPCLGRSGPLGMGRPGERSVPWTRTSCSQWDLVVSG